LPPHAIRNDVASLDDVANMLANHAIQAHSSQQEKQSTSSSSDAHDHFHVNELMEYIPRFQFGMDVNPRFTDCQGYEYTAELTVFDMLSCGRLLHGWLVDPINEEPTARAVGSRTYNELMDRIIAGREAEAQVSKLQSDIEQLKLNNPMLLDESSTALDLLDNSPVALASAAAHQKLAELQQKQDELQQVATDSHLIQHFLHESSHQLTLCGLERLHSTLAEDELCVFFRNNHYCTMTKHDQQLYLLVTDLGYSNTPGIVWEKLDVVDGDTEFCNSLFSYNGAAVHEQSGPTLTPEQMMAASSQNEADYQLALHLANGGNTNTGASAGNLDEQEGQIVAAATEASLREYNGLPANVGASAAASPTQATGMPADARIEVGIPVPNPPGSGVKNPPAVTTAQSGGIMSQEEADRMLAMQLAQEHPPPASSASPGGSGAGDAGLDEASLQLARQLQKQEDERASAAAVNAAAAQQTPRPQHQQTPRPRERPASNAASSQNNSNCTIM